jgi:molybdopterin/thiamine biosynthesis adenylyltransferase
MEWTGRSLSPEQIRRYARHILLPDIGGVGQKRLLESAVAIAVHPGEGAAIAALAYLAAAGVGRIVLTGSAAGPVTAAEVPRCILYGDADVGRPRVSAIADRIRAINPDVTIELGPGSEAENTALGLPGVVPLAALPEHAAAWLGSDHPDEELAAALVRGGMQAMRTLVALVSPDSTP